MRTAISLSVIRITVTPVPVDGPLPGVQLNISDRTRAVVAEMCVEAFSRTFGTQGPSSSRPEQLAIRRVPMFGGNFKPQAEQPRLNLPHASRRTIPAF